MSETRIGLLGFGTVGSAVHRLLGESAGAIERVTGGPVVVAGALVRDPSRRRAAPDGLLTTDFSRLRDDPSITVVAEVMGGIEPTRTYLLELMAAGKSVVSANKQLLARHGEELFAEAERRGVQLRFEASVCAAIPVVKVLRESLIVTGVHRIDGIVNGTTNFILTRMVAAGDTYAAALHEAQELGYAEADPTEDVTGADAAAKIAILASIAFHTRVTAADVYREGIAAVTSADMASARAMGCTVKLLALAERSDVEPGVSVRVHPVMIPAHHPLAGVREAFNAVYVEAESAGSLMFYGRGAGGSPTASAVLGDLVAVARNRVGGGRGPQESAYANLPVLPMGRTQTRYHVSLDVADKAGVLSAVAGAFAAHDVSISSVRQEGHGDDASLVLVTHTASDAALAATVEDLRGLDVVRAVASVMRVEGES
jgi:homoserine dehydrogenase